jgi:hypothetical protein
MLVRPSVRPVGPIAPAGRETICLRETIMWLKVAVGHLAIGDWENAHVIVQDDESALGCWAHGIVHLLEGDMDNAAYWYWSPPAHGTLL